MDTHIENDRKQYEKTWGIRKQIHWRKRYRGRYTNWRNRKHYSHQHRRYFGNLYRYSRNQFSNRRAKSLSLNKNHLSGFSRQGKTSSRSSSRIGYFQRKYRVNNPYIYHDQKLRLYGKKILTWQGNEDGKQYGTSRIKGTMLLSYGHQHSTTPGLKYDSGSINSLPDGKNPWVYWK